VSEKRRVTLNNYRDNEGACQCGCGLQMTDDMVLSLQAFNGILARLYGAPIRHVDISGARCLKHNATLVDANGNRISSDTSQHCAGIAADGHWQYQHHGKWQNIDPTDVAMAAVKSGLFGGVGYVRYMREGSNIVHLDLRPGPSPALGFSTGGARQNSKEETMFQSILWGGGLISIGAILRHFSDPILRVLRRGLAGVRDWLLRLDDRAEGLLPMKWQGDLKWVHEKYDAAITWIMAWLEGNVFSKAMVERIIYILSGKEGAIKARLLALFWETFDKAKSTLDIPEELMPIINQAKHELTLEHVQAVTTTLPVELQPTAPQINAAIVVRAPEIGRGLPVTPAANLGRTPEVQALVEQLRAKNATTVVQ
jgi:hypothetical protein